MTNSNTPLRSKTISILSIIFIGALGSGLWDIFLKDVAFYLGDLFVRFLSFVFSGYLDFLYKDVGKAGNFLVYLPSILIIVFIIFSPFFIYLTLTQLLNKIDSGMGVDRPNRKSIMRRVGSYTITNRRKALALILLPPLLASVLYVEFLIKELAQMSAVRFVERDLEIIRPYVDERKYFKLRSEYRLIDGKDKLEAIIIKMNDIAEHNEVKIPEVKLFGINIPKNV